MSDYCVRCGLHTNNLDSIGECDVCIRTRATFRYSCTTCGIQKSSTLKKENCGKCGRMMQEL